MRELTHVAGRSLDLSHPDVVFLVEQVVEAEHELSNAKRYLEECRRAAGAREGEMLIDAIRRVLGSEDAQSRDSSFRH